MSTCHHPISTRRRGLATPQGLRPHTSLLVLALGLTLGGCASINNKTAETVPSSRANVESTADASSPIIPPYTGGGYYKDDGPGVNPPDNLADIPDAVPTNEAFNRSNSRAYKVFGVNYVPIADNTNYKARGLASWYGRKFHGKTTANGEIYDMYAMTAAHATLPLPSFARVTNLENGKSVVVRLNDRGPFHPGRIIDLSYTAAFKLDILKGVTPVEVRSVFPGDVPNTLTAEAETPPAAISAPIAKAKPEQPNTSDHVYLQLGAFGNPASADNLLALASAKLSKDFPSVARIEGNGLHKIQAGPFTSVEAADRAAASIQQDLGIKAFKIFVAAPTAPAASDPVAENRLYLQLAAVSNQAAANAFANRVKSHYGNALPGVDQVNAGNLFKIQAGPFATPEAAARIALAYQQDFGVKPYRVTR
jgi:rare lipoprotein A